MQECHVLRHLFKPELAEESGGSGARRNSWVSQSDGIPLGVKLPLKFADGPAFICSAEGVAETPESALFTAPLLFPAESIGVLERYPVARFPCLRPPALHAPLQPRPETHSHRAANLGPRRKRRTRTAR